MLNYGKLSAKKNLLCRSGGQVVSVLAFNYDNPCSSPAVVDKLFVQ